MSDTAPRVPWTAIITTAVVVLAFLVSIGTGLISVGRKMALYAVESAKTG